MVHVLVASVALVLVIISIILTHPAAAQEEPSVNKYTSGCIDRATPSSACCTGGIEIATDIKAIAPYAFSGCALTYVKVSNSVEYIGPAAFAFNQISYLILGSSLTNIDVMAFSNNLISTLIIPIKVTSIGQFAFKTNLLKSVKIPDDITNVGNGAFASNTVGRDPFCLTYYGALDLGYPLCVLSQ